MKEEPGEGEDPAVPRAEEVSEATVAAPEAAAPETAGVEAVGEGAAQTEAGPPQEERRGERSVRDGRVVRDEEGVIVGAASQRSEPKILGFIPLEGRRQPQQVIITDASGDDRRGRASQRKQREERAQAQGRRRKMVRGPRGKEKALPARRSTAEMSEAKKRIRVDEVIQVSDLAHQLSQKAANILKVLWGMGMRGITINHAIDLETAELVAAEFGYTVENVAFQEEAITGGAPLGEGERRAPVVAVMGHVDHGKTSLLDRIRSTNVAKGEVGGITQHIGAYTVDTRRGDVVFLDTPGHEAFTAMRARGAQVTDIVVLVVAADDGVMPTTTEAIKHCQESQVPILVAINKIDKADANPGRVKQSLMEYGLVGEEFGGETIICEVSAKTGDGIDALLEMLALQAELLDLQAPATGLAHGVIIEARIDKGRGPVATVLMTSGTLHAGDIVVANESSGKIRRLFDQNGKKLKEAGPSVPVELLGLDSVPAAGDLLNAVESEKDAKQLVSHRREQRRRKESVRAGPSIQELMQRKRTPVLRIVLRADVKGSAEALKQALESESTPKVKVEVIKADVGAINETDVKYAAASEAVVIGFNVKTAGKAAPVAESENVKILTFSVIYDALDAVKELMIGLLEPEYRERERGEAEVRALFPIPRLGVVAGCRIVKGSVQRSDLVRVLREGSVVHKGPIASLRIFKDDVREVKEGFECGIVVEGFVDVQAGDMIQAYAIETTQPSLQ